MRNPPLVRKLIADSRIHGDVMHSKSLSLRLSRLLIATLTAFAVTSPLRAAGGDGGTAFLEKLSLNSPPASVLSSVTALAAPTATPSC